MYASLALFAWIDIRLAAQGLFTLGKSSTRKYYVANVLCIIAAETNGNQTNKRGAVSKWMNECFLNLMPQASLRVVLGIEGLSSRAEATAFRGRARTRREHHREANCNFLLVWKNKSRNQRLREISCRPS